MAYTKKTWVNVPDSSEYTDDELNSFPRFDAENMNRIEDGVDGAITSLAQKAPSGHGLGGVGDTKNNNNDTYRHFMRHGCGFYQVNSDDDPPDGIGSWMSLLQLVRNPNEGDETGAQVAFNDLDKKPRTWFRTVRAGTAQPWYEMLHTGNKDLIKLSDIGAAPSGHGLGDIADGTYDDTFNKLLQSGCGFYQVKDSTDSPNKSNFWIPVMQIARNKNEGEMVGAQMAFLDSFEYGKDAPKVWIRTASLNNFSDWYEIIHSGNISGHGLTNIAAGSYVGTGTSGSDNKNSLTFSFEPKFIFIHRAVAASSQPFVALVYGCRFFGDDSKEYTHVEWDGKTVRWWAHNQTAAIQYNASNTTYCYVAIG